MKQNKLDTSKLETLTVENATKALYIISKTNPEWGIKKFNFDNSGHRHHTWSVGGNGALLFEKEFQFWAVVEFIK